MSCMLEKVQAFGWIVTCLIYLGFFIETLHMHLTVPTCRPILAWTSFENIAAKREITRNVFISSH